MAPWWRCGWRCVCSCRTHGLLKVDLRHNGLGPAAAGLLAEVLAATVAGCGAVVATKALFLGGNRLGDDGAQALLPAVARSAVTALDLSDNGLGPAAAAALAEALPRCKNLADLDVSRNRRLESPQPAELKWRGTGYRWCCAGHAPRGDEHTRPDAPPPRDPCGFSAESPWATAEAARLAAAEPEYARVVQPT